MKRRILVVDIGGSFVKLLMSERVEREFASGPRMTPKQFLAKFKETVKGWKFDVASIGFPAPVRNGRILRNPKHLGKDWVHFSFARALGIPVRIVNDAAMQALGSYLGDGRMLFLGLGTGLDPRWCGTEILCHSSWATSPTRTERSLRTISVSPAWRNWARENGNVKSFMPSAN